jgi:regulation of enolase protein 1 (concanavalin A-like superfamily)
MKNLSWSDGHWSRHPISIVEVGSTLEVEAAAKSDWWRNTSYGFIHDDGHALLREFHNESAIEVSFILNYSEQFDQAGLFITSGSEDWIKAGVEYCDGLPQIGAVVTHVNSDWSVAPVAEWMNKEVTVRISRSGDAVTVRAGIHGDLRLVRVAPLEPKRDWQAGPMFCAPTRAGLKVTFTRWAEGEADEQLHPSSNEQ